jgi:hypothetical protein
MKQKVRNLMNQVKFSMNCGAYLALMDDDGKILYNNLRRDLNGIFNKLFPAVKTLNTGDFQVNRFADSHLVTIKVSDRLALVAESYLRESSLIFVLNNIAEKLRGEFAELDTLLNPLAIPE